jgi:acetoin utilization deacetylase AcuC-like enzyme
MRLRAWSYQDRDMSGRLAMVEQRGGVSSGNGHAGAAPYILDRHGRRTDAHDDGRRTEEVREGLTRDGRVVPFATETSDERLQEILAAIHDPGYLDTLHAVDWEDPRIVPELAPPGLPADSPLWASIVEIAFEGARTAVAAADRIADGERFAYALSRPPGHHAGPAWLGGYCYLNTAAAAAHALCERGMGPVAVVDVDFHFPTGTSAIVAPLQEVSLGSLHASTLAEVPWREVQPGERERFVAFDSPPSEAEYLSALEAILEDFGYSCCALVLSLGYDAVQTDPHGSWQFEPAAFERIGALLAGTGLPVCVVQEGGYSLAALAECAEAFATGLLDGWTER